MQPVCESKEVCDDNCDRREAIDACSDVVFPSIVVFELLSYSEMGEEEVVVQEVQAARSECDNAGYDDRMCEE